VAESFESPKRPINELKTIQGFRELPKAMPSLWFFSIRGIARIFHKPVLGEGNAMAGPGYYSEPLQWPQCPARVLRTVKVLVYVG